MERTQFDKNGCIRSDWDFDTWNTNNIADAHTLTSRDVTQPDGTIKRYYDIKVPTLKLGDEDDKV